LLGSSRADAERPLSFPLGSIPTRPWTLRANPSLILLCNHVAEHLVMRALLLWCTASWSMRRGLVPGAVLRVDWQVASVPKLTFRFDGLRYAPGFTTAFLSLPCSKWGAVRRPDLAMAKLDLLPHREAFIMSWARSVDWIEPTGCELAARAEPTRRCSTACGTTRRHVTACKSTSRHLTACETTGCHFTACQPMRRHFSACGTTRCPFTA